MNRLNTESIQFPFSSGDMISKIAYDANNNPEYMGQATPGTSVSEVGWQIKKFTYDVNQNVTDIQFAEGSNLYNRVWDSRASYSYS